MSLRRPLGRASARALSLLALLVLLLPLHLAAQTTGGVRGTVTASDGRPVAGAWIALDGADPVAQTGVDGRYAVNGIAVGAHRLEVRRSGFVSRTASVTVTAGQETVVDVAMDAASLSAVTVIGTSSDLDETREALRLTPGATALVTAQELRRTRQANLKDVLGFVPGVYVQPRFGAADESQISIRGSGLRNNFHARGVNLLVNGMPYRNADGFTDFESLELLTTDAIAVHKGANALRFGGSTLGGAIDLQTKTGHTAPRTAAFAEGGSFGYLKTQVEGGGASDGKDFYASYARTAIGGFRDWSGQSRDRINLHAGLTPSERSSLRAFYFFARVDEELPGSLTAAELAATPDVATAANRTDRWGRAYDLHHVGVQYRVQLTPTQRLDIAPYMQYRDIDHPIFEVINQQSQDFGAEFRYENTAAMGARANRFTLGFQPATESMRNRQYVNVVGEHGALTRDEQDKATNLAVYAENALSVTPRLTLVAGVRMERATRTVEDDFVSNGDQSDERTFTPVSPRIGAIYRRDSGTQWYANASRTVEPPIFVELTSFGGVGGFLPLDAQSAWQYEIGVRGRRGALTWDVAAYDVELTDELVNINVPPFVGAPFTVPSYRNVDATRHRGVEAAVQWQVADRSTLRLGYTWSDFTYVTDSAFAGNRLPGAPEHHLVADLRIRFGAAFSVTPAVEWVPSSYFVNSANTVENDAWMTVGLRAEYLVPSLGLTVFVSGQNLTDEIYSAAVTVDDGNGRFFQPADRRAIYAGLRWTR
ncbi:MAG: TonB-dependent receptor [Gemmatimonadetes bacterium]|nr:TonB-dependent receptor [Gemmatimonadota bacterium]